MESSTLSFHRHVQGCNPLNLSTLSQNTPVVQFTYFDKAFPSQSSCIGAQVSQPKAPSGVRAPAKPGSKHKGFVGPLHFHPLHPCAFPLVFTSFLGW
ncbi:hypothetical protein CEXT_209971 [Caerostris extrusa]|uniref:Uncharacterized protein n=1 Tax=Caerostris extrusa TaxID=172846 RepID=A0AAV4V1F0_CAEEX|nr:hypothetical protein CEXT_209971 [Caerostris extrusa]